MNEPETSDAAVVDILNELLADEQRNLAAVLMESTVFISGSSVADLQCVRQLAADGQEHARRLADAIQRLGGVPGPRRIDPTTADLHFQELHRVVPRLAAEQNLLVQKYTRAADRVADRPQIQQLLRGIQSQHEQVLTALGPTPQPAAG